MRSLRIALLACLWTGGLSAQEADVPRRRLSISGTIGGVLGGPASSAAGTLTSIGWGDTRPAYCFLWCTDAANYPQTTAGASAELTIRYELTHRWAVSAGTTRLGLGDATGYRDGPADLFGTPGDHVYLSYSGSSHWIAGHVKPAGPLSAGVGIALHRAHNQPDPVAGMSQSTHRRLGVLGETAIRLGRESRVFWELVARGHWVPGSVRFIEPTARHGPITLDAGLSYATITTGIGIRM